MTADQWLSLNGQRTKKQEADKIVDLFLERLKDGQDIWVTALLPGTQLTDPETNGIVASKLQALGFKVKTEIDLMNPSESCTYVLKPTNRVTSS